MVSLNRCPLCDKPLTVSVWDVYHEPEDILLCLSCMVIEPKGMPVARDESGTT